MNNMRNIYFYTTKTYQHNRLLHILISSEYFNSRDEIKKHLKISINLNGKWRRDHKYIQRFNEVLHNEIEIIRIKRHE